MPLRRTGTGIQYPSLLVHHTGADAQIRANTQYGAGARHGAGVKQGSGGATPYGAGGGVWYGAGPRYGAGAVRHGASVQLRHGVGEGARCRETNPNACPCMKGWGLLHAWN